MEGGQKRVRVGRVRGYVVEEESGGRTGREEEGVERVEGQGRYGGLFAGRETLVGYTTRVHQGEYLRVARGQRLWCVERQLLLV